MNKKELDEISVLDAVYVVTEKRKLFQSLVGQLYLPIVAEEINYLEIKFEKTLSKEFSEVRKRYPCVLSGSRLAVV